MFCCVIILGELESDERSEVTDETTGWRKESKLCPDGSSEGPAEQSGGSGSCKLCRYIYVIQRIVFRCLHDFILDVSFYNYRKWPFERTTQFQQAPLYLFVILMDRVVLKVRNGWEGQLTSNRINKIWCSYYKGPFKCYVTFSFWKIYTRPPRLLLINKIEPYTFVTLFSGKFDNPTALRNTWMPPNECCSYWNEIHWIEFASDLFSANLLMI